MLVLAIDPGSKKCGMALVCSQTGILVHEVVPVGELASSCSRLHAEYQVDFVIIGGSTCSNVVRRNLEKALSREIITVDERYSTERGRLRYYQDNPPRGLWRFVPLGLQLPPCPYDDYAAVVLAEDFIAHRPKN